MQQKALEVFQGTEVISEEAFSSLVEDLKDILTEGVHCVREKVIETKWELGNRLLEDEKVLTKDVVSRVTLVLHVAERELQRCLAFRKQFPTLKQMWSEVPEGKNVSWHKLINKYIDFKMPKPMMPILDKYDDWGIIDWWVKNQPHMLRLMDKKTSFALIIREAKVPQGIHQGIADLYKEIVDFYVAAKRWDKGDLGRDDFARLHRAIKTLLEKAHGDKEKVKAAISWCHKQYIDGRIDWTMDTVLKKFPEASRKIKPHEKYMTKERL